jgi:hypothetical protein
MIIKTPPVVNIRSLLRAWLGGAAAGAIVAFILTIGALDLGEALSLMVFIFIVNSFALFPLLALLGLLLIVIRRNAPAFLERRATTVAILGIGAGVAQGGATFAIAAVAPVGHGAGLADMRNILAAAAGLSGLVTGVLMAMSATARSASLSVEPEGGEKG